MPDLSSKIALVTGASSGIGQQTAIQLGRLGCRLLLQYRANEKGITETTQKLDQMGCEYRIFRRDFLETETLTAFCDEAWSWKNELDFVINLAGGDVLTNEKRNWTFEEKLQFLWQTDVQSTMIISRHLGERLKQLNKNPKPLIVNIGWDQAPAGQAGENGQIFSATKGAIMAFSRSLAKTLAPHVRVNCVAPGWIRTSWGNSTSTYWDQRAKKESLMERWGTAADVAHAICTLADDQSEFINGQTIEVNGGIGFGRS